MEQYFYLNFCFILLHTYIHFFIEVFIIWILFLHILFIYTARSSEFNRKNWDIGLSMIEEKTKTGFE